MKPYKNLIPEEHHIKYPFLERNIVIIGWLALIAGVSLAVYYALT